MTREAANQRREGVAVGGGEHSGEGACVYGVFAEAENSGCRIYLIINHPYDSDSAF